MASHDHTGGWTYAAAPPHHHHHPVVPLSGAWPILELCRPHPFSVAFLLMLLVLILGLSTYTGGGTVQQYRRDVHMSSALLLVVLVVLWHPWTPYLLYPRLEGIPCLAMAVQRQRSRGYLVVH